MKQLLLKWPLLALVPFTLPLLKSAGPSAFPQSLPVIRHTASVQAPQAIEPLYTSTTHVRSR